MKYENEVFTIQCISCGNDASASAADYTPQFVEEVQQYENFTIECSTCGTVTVINVNIPVHAEEEAELLQRLNVPEAEMQLRAAARALMWDKRPDLQQKGAK